jgi:magnesium chelatase subunit I
MRVSDIFASLPAITGKLELEYEGEMQGAENVTQQILTRAAGGTFEARAGGADCDDIVEWFEQGGALKVSPDERADLCVEGFSEVADLLDLTRNLGLAPRGEPATVVAACELILEGLVAQKRLARSDEFGYSRVRQPRRRTAGEGGPELLA